MKSIYWWQSSPASFSRGSSGKPINGRRYRRENLSYRPVAEKGSFWSYHGTTLLICLFFAVVSGAALVFLLSSLVTVYYAGFLYHGVAATGLVVSVLYPFKLYRDYRIMNDDHLAGTGAIEVTARIETDVRDPVVTLQYRWGSGMLDVPMGRKDGNLFAAVIPRESEEDGEHLSRYNVIVEGGGEAKDVSVSIH